MKSLSHSHRFNPLACGNYSPPCILKPFVSLLFALAVAVPTVSAGEPLPPGVMKTSENPEEIKIGTDAPDAKVLKASETASYTEWESLGMASWNIGLWRSLEHYMGETGENHFKVSKRTNIDKPELIQVKLEGVFGGADFIIDGNMSTYECTAVRQPTNYDCTDIEGAEQTTFEAYILNDLPAFFSLAGGQFSFSLGFYFSDIKYVYFQTVRLTLDDAPQFSYTIEGRHVYGKDETSATINLKPSGAVQQFKYLLAHGYSSATTIFKNHSDKLQTATTSITVPLETGCHTLHILPCDAQGNWLGFEIVDGWFIDHRSFAIHSNRSDNYEWIPYGSVTIHEGVCRDNNVNAANTPEPFVCEALTRKDAPGKFLRIVNPYSPQSPVGSVVLANGDSRYELTDEDFYIDVNLEDRDKPYLYNRPIGLEIFIGAKIGSDGWLPIGTECYRTHNQILTGTDPQKIEYATYKWNRLTFGQGLSLEIELEDNNLSLKDKNISEEMTLTLQADNNVEYIKYAFISEGYGTEIADKIAAGDASLTIYTASVDKALSRSAERTVTIKVPSDVSSKACRLVAVPYTAQFELSGTYLDSEINLWHSIGNAEITGAFVGTLGLNASAATQQLSNSMKFRLVKPSANKGASEYIYIDASDPQFVNISSDGETEDIHTGLYFDGYSKYNDVFFNTAHNYVTTGVLNLSQYNVPVLNGRTITAPQNSMVYFVVNAEDNGMRAYWLGDGTITLPEWKKEAGVETVTTDEADADVPFEYYNLQGVKIINPGPGLYIRRQGSKASKILIR